MPTDPHHTPIITQPSSSQPQRKKKSRRSKRKDTEVPQPSDPTNVAYEVVNEEPTSLGDQEDAYKQERKIHDIDADEDITLENVHDAEMFDVNDLHGDEVFVEKEVLVKEVSAVGKVNTASIATIVSAATITLSESITTTTTIPSKDKGKGIMVEEPLQMKKKDQISFDEQEAIRLQAEFDEEAMIKTDYEKAQRLQAKEEEELTVDEKATLFQQLLEKRRKYFTAKRAEEKRNRPPTRSQQRSIMCTYLKNMAGWKPKDLKSKTELVECTEMEESSKRAEGSKKMKELMKIVPDEVEVAVDAIPLATKPPSIMLRSFDKEDLETLWKLVKAKQRRCSVEEFTRKQSIGLEAICFLWSTLCEVSKIKRLLDDLRVTAAQVCVTTAKQKAIHKWIYSTKEVIDNGCSRHMTGNMSYLTDFEEIDGGYVAFGGNPKEGESQTKIETVTWQKDYILLPLWTADPPFSQSSKSSPEKKVTKEARKEGGDSSKDSESNDQEKEDNVNSTNTVNAASTNEVNAVGAKTSIELPDDLNMHELEDIIYSDDDADVGAEADMNNLDAFMPVSPILTTRIHKDHLVKQIIGDLNLAPQTRRMTKNLEEHVGCQSDFLYGKIEEEVYVCQPPGFEDPNFTDRVYTVENALYGL
ncbi:retrovirus-related pol polyprotein from transposon TNT 1-94 [Tanacetum coccineum]